MIKRMRLKFIVIAIVALLLTLVSIFLTINIFMEQKAREQIDRFLISVIENDGIAERPIPIPGGAPRQVPAIESFSFVMSSDGKQVELIQTNVQLSDELLLTYGKDALNKQTYFGEVDSYRYLWKKIDDKYLFVFANTSMQNEMLEQLLQLSYLIGSICTVVLFVVIVILSKYVTKPVEVAFEKQKRFIADSSHELKTPLSILAANLDVLKMEMGSNQRIDAMDDSVKRMNGLIRDLLILARTEQNNQTFQPFDLSRLVERTVLPFEVVAFEHGNQIEATIEPNVMMTGSVEDIRKMIDALMDNAIKYSRPNTTIRVKLYKKGNQKIMEFYNEGIGVSKDEKEKLFETFYRVDDSRQRETGGYGLGLSIVKNVVDKHKGKILVDSIPGQYIRFKITFFS